jgi:hypothetical protein
MKVKTAADLLSRAIVDAARVADYIQAIATEIDKLDADEDVSTNISRSCLGASEAMLVLRRRLEDDT